MGIERNRGDRPRVSAGRFTHASEAHLLQFNSIPHMSKVCIVGLKSSLNFDHERENQLLSFKMTNIILMLSGIIICP